MKQRIRTCYQYLYTMFLCQISMLVFLRNSANPLRPSNSLIIALHIFFDLCLLMLMYFVWCTDIFVYRSKMQNYTTPFCVWPKQNCLSFCSHYLNASCYVTQVKEKHLPKIAKRRYIRTICTKVTTNIQKFLSPRWFLLLRVLQRQYSLVCCNHLFA